ncbi:hypothetical protein F5Y17DRAFT_244726 [Xylariaceae sp. FL0594]|nr:hypothetical protein F5Y17DRAFT_244726 [Xylariaceae sp. FL0594]
MSTPTKEQLLVPGVMDVWTREKLALDMFATDKRRKYLLNNQDIDTYDPLSCSPSADAKLDTDGDVDLAAIIRSLGRYEDPEKTALIPRADQTDSDANVDLEANVRSESAEGRNNPGDNGSSSWVTNIDGGDGAVDAEAEAEGEEGDVLLFSDHFVESVHAIAGTLDHGLQMVLRHFEPLTRSLTSLVDAVTALLHFLPDFSKDVMNFVNRLFDASLRFVSDFFAEAVPRTIVTLTAPLGETGGGLGRGVLHLSTMALTAAVRLARLGIKVAGMVAGVALVVGLVLWFTGGREVLGALVVAGLDSGKGKGTD